ncbi:MAG: VCBS repeat-containing protein, partial [Candidatus Promineifilaceae bacterium]
GLADLDGDDDLDVFTAVQNGANTVWINQGGTQGGTEGIFLDSGQTLGTGSSLNVALGDLDNDNDIDAFVANSAENIVWINQGGTQGGTEGNFQFNGQLLGFSASTEVQLADLDNDSDLDAFVAEFGPNTVWVNQGGVQGGVIGQFTDSGLTLGNQTSNGVALADVDGDNDMDAFIANSGPSPNKVYLNDSNTGPTPVNPEGWQIQLVETRGDTGYSPSIALDSNGYPHIAYFKHVVLSGGYTDRIYHLYWDGVRWHNDYVAFASSIGNNISLALDSSNNPHIAFAATSGDSKGLKYTYWDGMQWQTWLIESENFKESISLALDSSDNPHVTYAMSEPAGTLRYAFWDGTTWQKHNIETVTPSFDGFTSLVLDNNNRPHLAYYNQATEQLKYAHYDGTTWQINIIDANSDFFTYDNFFSLALFGNTPSVAYYKDFGETLVYAEWDGGSWQSQTVLTTTFPKGLTGDVSLAVDSTGDPHIAYAHDLNVGSVSIRSIYWDGAQWQNEILDTIGSVGQRLDMVLDANDKPQIAYQDDPFGDLRFISWDKNWQIRTVADPGQMSGTDIKVQNTMPYLGYHNHANGLVSLTHWDDSWEKTSADFVNNPIPQLSLALPQNKQLISYYDADAQALMYARHTYSGWSNQIVDDQGDVGRYNNLVLPANQSILAHIAYWDETNRKIKIAAYNVYSDTFTLFTDTAAPSLPPGSGPLSASVLDNGNIGIAYYDAAITGLRFAVWNLATESWTDELIDSAGGDMGRLNSLQTDTACGCPTVAYYDETNDAIKYAYKMNGLWQIETVTPNAGGVSSLSLALGLNSLLRPRLTYITANTSHFVHKEGNLWEFEIIAEGINNPGSAALALDIRPHIAYPDALDGMEYAFRTATLDVDTMVYEPPEFTGGGYNALTPCGAIADFIFGDGFDPLPLTNHRPPSGGETSLGDDGIYEGMAMLFNQTGGGQDYIGMYFDNAPEMAQIGLEDPQLMWDGYGTLQNFLPGLEGLVTGNGDQYLVTQQMVDDALDIWTRISAAASPQLANTINSQLAQYNNLQDFVGMSFDEWALAIGVNPPADNVYLPVILR